MLLPGCWRVGLSGLDMLGGRVNSPAQATPRAGRGMLVARLVVAVAFLDLFMQFPVIGPYARELGATPTLAGVIVAAYSLSNLCGNLVAGIFLDRWGRIVPLQVGLLLTSLALFGYVASDTPLQLLGARLVHGLSAAVLAPGAFALIGDLSSADSRLRAMGKSSTAIAFAAVVGPASAGLIASAAGFKAVFLCSASLMLLMFLVFVVSRARPDTVESRPVGGESRGVVYGALVVCYVAVLAMTVGQGALITHLPTWFLAQGKPEYWVGILFASYAATGMAVMASPLLDLGKRYRRWFSLAVGLSLIAVGLGVLGALQSTPGTLAGMVIFGAGFGVTFPCLTSMVVDATPVSARGKAFGVFYAIYSLGVVIGAVASGLLQESLADSTPAPFFLGMVVLALAVPVTYAIDSIRRTRVGS